jgi:hypothetical protein
MLPQHPRNLGADDAQRQRIFEYERTVTHLMRRAPLRNPIRRPAGLPSCIARF